jgi:hypothetical protein
VSETVTGFEGGGGVGLWTVVVIVVGEVGLRRVGSGVGAVAVCAVVVVASMLAAGGAVTGVFLPVPGVGCCFVVCTGTGVGSVLIGATRRIGGCGRLGVRA